MKLTRLYVDTFEGFDIVTSTKSIESYQVLFTQNPPLQ